MSTIMITGAGSGFGRGAAIELARRGHEVIATTFDEAQAADLAAAEPQLQAVKLDITSEADRQQAAGWPVDVLIDNAGLGQVGPLALVPMELVRRVFEVNVFGTLAITQVVAAGMIERGSGRIIIVSSVAGLRAGPGSGPYSMTKHALQAMGGALRAELAPHGIDVCLVNPGPFATGFNDAMVDRPGEWFDSAGDVEREMVDRLRSRITVGQRDPEQVVGVLADLAEADTTELHNLVPPDILEQLAAAR
jgi:NAD(P)-dependent dehydrogenase (short-subunit alcohol dehydrogenase family)